MSYFGTIAEIRAANKAAGFFWFSPKTVKHFRSKVRTKVYAMLDGNDDYPEGCRFWVESTRNEDDTAREFKIARFNVETQDVMWVHRDYTTVRFDSLSDAIDYLLTTPLLTKGTPV